MGDGWLTRANARSKAELKIALLRQKANRSGVTVGSQEEAIAVTQYNRSWIEILRRLFDSSVGVVFPDAINDPETWYITSARGTNGDLAGEQLISWTHWLGRVATRLRNAFENGEYPSSLVYGPIGRELELPVGPLVDYSIGNHSAVWELILGIWG